jgi:hypothetical protein
MHQKLPTDDKLMERGCHLPSVCSLCYAHIETTSHLFFQCSFAISLWTWFLNLININFHITCSDDLWNICDRGWGPQCRIVIVAAIINILNSIWLCRNQNRFNNVKPSLNSVKAMIIANTSFTGNATKSTTTSSMVDFRILKAFNVSLHPPKAPSIKEVVWLPPIVSWVKCNTDGAALGSPGLASCAGVFRDHNAHFLGCFTENLGINFAFHAEILGVINAI